jgi:iron complex transport system substrate-binding protein
LKGSIFIIFVKKFIAIFLCCLLAVACTGHRGKAASANARLGATRDSALRIVCMSTTHIAALHALGADSLIVGVSGAQYVSNPEIRKRLDEGKVADIGYEAGIDWEKLISLKPDVIFAYDVAGENAPYIEKMRKFGLNVVMINDYLKEDPLGRLEVLRTFGEYLCNEEKADSIIKRISAEYIKLKGIAANDKRVKVLMNVPYRNVWYIAGEDNYLSTLVRDAGGTVVGAVKGEVKSKAYSVEEAFILAQKADIWLLQTNDGTLAEVKAQNPLFEEIPALKSGNVWNNSLHTTPGGGNDFWESGIVEPQFILEDMIRMFHPGILPDGDFHFYKRLDK